MKRDQLFTALSFLLIGVFFLTACQPKVVEVTKIVEVEKKVEVPVQVEVPKEVEVLITPTPLPIPQGGTLVTSSFADANILNPILSSDSSSSTVHSKLFLGLVTTDPFSGEIVGEVAKDWDVSEDGLTYTFHMRDDIFWSDGEPLTAHDFVFTYNAVNSELVDTPRKSMTELMESFEALDDYTVQVVFKDIDCTGLSNVGLGILPSHLYAEDFSDVMTNPENTAPTVSVGPFMFKEWVAGDHITLTSNPNYYLGAPNVDGWIYRIFADQSAELAALLAGEIDYSGVGPQYVSTIEGAIASGKPLQMKKFFDDGYVYVGFNMADPSLPTLGFVDTNENGTWDDGEVVNTEQPKHPVLSDVAVRQAIAQSIDYTNIINKVAFGQAAPMLANVLPAVGWAFDTSLEGYKFDMDAAKALLDGAGWVDTDGDGVREKDGVPLAFRIMTNAGNETRENIVAILKDNLDGIGFDITLEVLEWGTVIPRLLGQEFDAIVIGWTGMGSDPEDSVFWLYRNDYPGGGFNFVSYYNPKVEEALLKARSLPGCGTEERAALYKTVQEEIHADAPYAFLYNPLGNVIWNTRVQGINPGPWATTYNMEEWFIQP